MCHWFKTNVVPELSGHNFIFMEFYHENLPPVNSQRNSLSSSNESERFQKFKLKIFKFKLDYYISCKLPSIKKKCFYLKSYRLNSQTLNV